jgi:hypothetical protein
VAIEEYLAGVAVKFCAFCAVFVALFGRPSTYLKGKLFLQQASSETAGIM